MTPAHDPPARLAVFLSGSGRTMVNLAERIEAGELPATIALVVASRECLGVERAHERGFPVHLIPGAPSGDQLAHLLREHAIDWVVLAGYTVLLPIPEGFDGRVVNIHPALLPNFGGPGMFGMNVHRAVIEAGETESGCTVHLCDAQYDTGPVLLQLKCPVEENDTPEDLASRVFSLELEAYPQALRGLLEGTTAP